MSGGIPKTTRCRACNAEIMFIETALYKKTPVDAEPVWVRPDVKSKSVYVLPTGGTISGEIVGDAYEGPEELKMAFVSHFATCTNPDGFRKPRKPRDRTKKMEGAEHGIF